QHWPILAGVHQDGHARVVLGGGPDHGRPADVDALQDVVEGGGGPAGRLLEGVQVDRDEVDRLDPVEVELAQVLGVVAPGQDAAVDRRVEGLDAAVQHLGEAGQLGDLADPEAGPAQGPGGAARRDQLDAERGQAPAQLDDAGLVGDGEQRPAD